MTAAIIRQAAHELPAGRVTFLFSDVEGSTQLSERHGAAAQEALARHQAILCAAIETHRAHVFNVVGDGFCVAFAHADEADNLRADR